MDPNCVEKFTASSDVRPFHLTRFRIIYDLSLKFLSNSIPLALVHLEINQLGLAAAEDYIVKHIHSCPASSSLVDVVSDGHETCSKDIWVKIFRDMDIDVDAFNLATRIVENCISRGKKGPGEFRVMWPCLLGESRAFSKKDLQDFWGFELVLSDLECGGDPVIRIQVLINGWSCANRPSSDLYCRQFQ
jgi:hypothetical protein